MEWLAEESARVCAKVLTAAESRVNVVKVFCCALKCADPPPVFNRHESEISLYCEISESWLWRIFLHCKTIIFVLFGWYNH